MLHTSRRVMLLYSANTAKSLDKLTANYQQWAEQSPEKAGDLAYTLARRREHLTYRSFAVFNNNLIVKAPPAVKDVRKPNIVMVFTGQGAQWPLMGRELIHSHKSFHDSIRSLDAALASSVQGGPGYSIEEELLKPGKLSQVEKAAFS